MIAWRVTDDIELPSRDGLNTVALKEGDVVHELWDDGDEDDPHLCFFPGQWPYGVRFLVPNNILEPV